MVKIMGYALGRDRFADEQEDGEAAVPQPDAALRGRAPSDPPAELDGAVVLWVTKDDAALDLGVVHYMDEDRYEPIAALAVCEYAAYPGSVYVFKCTADWQVLQDSYHRSVEEAMAAYEEEMGPIPWRRVGTISEEMRQRAREALANKQASLPADYASDETLRALAAEGRTLEAVARLRQVRTELGLAEAARYIKKLSSE